MIRTALAAGVRQLRGKLEAQQRSEQSDEQLLHAFLSRREEAAFAALVHRHGPMVLHVCRRILGQEQDAEDAFQATFFVLARHAFRLRNRASLASFLHGIAYRTALKAKQSAARRRKHERLAPPHRNTEPSSALLWDEVRALLDEEIVRLSEKYRNVFVLFYLQGLSREETARRLMLKEGTVASRLAEARKRLGQRLARRGVELTALLAAVSVATQTASALPPAMMAATDRAAMVTALDKGAAGLVSGPVAELANSTASAAMLSKIKIVTAMLLIVAASGSLVGLYQGPSEPLAATTEPPAAKADDKPNAATPPPGAAKTVVLKGRVLGPDGQPVKGARLYSVHTPNVWPRNDAVVALAQPEPTGVDGLFHVRTNRPGRDEYVYLIAHAPGFGVDWIELSESDRLESVTLRLVKDAPITGRVVNTEGRPVAGVSVSVATILASVNEKLDDYLAGLLRDFRNFRSGAALPKLLLVPLDGIIGKATTDKDGRFTLHGAGSERIVHVAFSGAGVARTTPWIITRPGFDTKPYNAVLRNKENEYLLRLNRFPGLFPPSFTFIAEAGKAIEGVVKDADTGKPLAGCRLATQTSYGHGVAVVSDAEGRYRIDGLAKRANGHYVTVLPPKDTLYLGRGIDVADAVGFAATRLDFELAKGVLVTGRVVDRQTGNPVHCYVRSTPLPGNKYFGTKPGYGGNGSDSAQVGEDGRFRLVTIPGKALLIAGVVSGEKLQGETLNVYRRAVPDPDYRTLFIRSGDTWRITTADGGWEFLSGQNAVKVVDIEPNGETRVELTVDRGTTARIVVQDTEGKPLAGAWTAGLTDIWPTAHRLPEATATVYALNPERPRAMNAIPPSLGGWIVRLALDSEKPRTLAFYHAEQKLGGIAKVRGDEKQPVVVTLAPVGQVTGRLLDRDGNPLEGVEVSIDAHTEIAGTALYRSAAPTGKLGRTDKDGRFRIEGVIPGLRFILNLRKERTFFVGEPCIGVKLIKPGEILDLGDFRVKPAR